MLPRPNPADHPIYRNPDYVTFITIRAQHSTRPFTDEPLCELALSTLRSEQQRLLCQVFAYCLMPDHLHFLVAPSTNHTSVVAFVRQFKGKTTNASWRVGWKGPLWQRGHFDRVLAHPAAVLQVAQYIFDNPERAGLVKAGDTYRWVGEINPLPM